MSRRRRIIYQYSTPRMRDPMIKLLTAFVLAFLLIVPAEAQTWVPWQQPGVSSQPARKANPKAGRAQKAKPKPQATARASTSPSFNWWSDDEDEDERPQRQSQGPALLEGGARPSIAPQSPQSTRYVSNHPAGTIVIDTAARRLYLVQSATTALVYPVAVGREGFTWTGTQRISRMANWPDWHPPAEMRQRDPRLPIKMTGGIRNPLGAKALYLGNTLYRIHGSNDARSIGRAASSGCFRMHNHHVIDLARRVGVGTRVVVVRGSGTRTAEAR